MVGKKLSSKNLSAVELMFQQAGILLLESGYSTQDLLASLNLESVRAQAQQPASSAPSWEQPLIEATEELKAQSVSGELQGYLWKKTLKEICRVLSSQCREWLDPWLRLEPQSKDRLYRELVAAVEVELTQLFAKLPEPEESQQQPAYISFYAAGESPEQKLAAGKVADNLAERILFKKVDYGIEIFINLVLNTVFWSSSLTDEERSSAIASYWQDLKKILLDGLEESKTLKDATTSVAAASKEVSESELVASSVAAASKEVSESELVASNDAIVIRSPDFEIGEPLKAGSNLRPFSGSLLRVDEPSETPPAQGPAYPLLVPRAVAEEVVAEINASAGLPIDVDSSLVAHCDESITGIMTRAEIQGSDLMIHGRLFEHNRPEVVQNIIAQQQELGMSVNGTIRYFPQDVGGRQVAVAAKLVPKGAAILKSASATWQKTRIKAQASHNQTQPMSNNNEIIDFLQKNVVSRLDSSESKLNELETRLSAQSSELTALKQERETAEAQIAAQKAQEAKVAEQSALTEAIVKQVEERLTPLIANTTKAQVKKSVNPSLQPVSLTNGGLPLVAGANSTAAGNPEVEELKIKAASLQSKLSVMESHNIVGAERITVTDQLRKVREQISLYA